MHNSAEFSQKLHLEIAQSINGTECPGDDKSRIAAALFDIVHEHHQAVLCLIQNKLYGSAASLLRSIVESYARGVWVLKCASNKDIEQFKRDRFKDGTFEDRLKEIHDIEDNPHSSALLNLKVIAWNALNSYTHGGFRAISRRFKEGELAPNYSLEEITGIERLSNAFAILAVFQIAELQNNSLLLAFAEKTSLEFKRVYTN